VSYLTDSFDSQVIELLKTGGVGLVPTETVYGISCSAFNADAAIRIYKIKKRDPRYSFVTITSPKWLSKLGITDDFLQTAQAYWPAALTVVLKAQNAPPHLMGSENTIAVRVPDSKKLLSFLDKTGPLISTSANFSGHPFIDSAQEARKIFNDGLDFYIDSGVLSGPPSTIIRMMGGEVRVLRQGTWQIPL